MRALKTIVITLAVAIAAGFGILVYGLAHNWQQLAGGSAGAPPKPAVPLTPWGQVALGQAPDSRIQSIAKSGRLIVVQVVSNNDERLLVLDPATGTLIGTFALSGPKP